MLLSTVLDAGRYSDQIIRFRTEGPWRTLHSGSQSVILRSTASMSPGNSNWLGMPILGPQPTPSSSETLAAEPSNLI